MANNVKFLIGLQPTPILLSGTLSMAANEENEYSYITITNGHLHYAMAKGFKVPWGVAFEITRVFSTSNVTISTLNSSGAKVLIKTVNANTLYEGSLQFGGQESVFIEGSAEIELITRALRAKSL